MSEQSKSSIAVHGITHDVLELIINYAYTGKVMITKDNVRNLLPAATRMQLLAVRDACCKFLKEQLDSSNCLEVRSFAFEHSYEDLLKASDEFILNNFDDVVLSEEFLSLSFEVVCGLISSLASSACDQEDVYDAAIRWTQHDIKSREAFLPSLLGRVKLHLISRAFIRETVSSEQLVRENLKCCELLFEAMKYYLSPECRSQLNDQASNSPVGLKNYIFFVSNKQNVFYQLDRASWIPCARTQYARLPAGITSLHQSVYAIGGKCNSGVMSSGERYDPLTDLWKYIRSMDNHRMGFGITSLNGVIFVAGGSDGSSYFNSVEMYDPLVNAWTADHGNTKRWESFGCAWRMFICPWGWRWNY